MKKLFLSILFVLGLSASLVLADDFVPADEEESAASTFVIGSGTVGADVVLQFGDVLGQFLAWDDANGRFSLGGDLSLNAGELINARLENLAAAPVCDVAATGRVYFDTVLSAAFVCNGTTFIELGGSGGGGTAQPLATARYRDTSTTNLNAAATDNVVPWNAEDFADSVFVHDTVTNNSQIQVTEAGKYLVSGAVSLFSASARYNGILKFRVNGVTTLPMTFQPGYIRNASGQNETSLNFSAVLDLGANDFFEILVDRESATGAATMISGASSLSVVQLQAIGGSGGGGAPFIDATVDLLVQPSTTQTVTITGSGFLPTSTVSFPGFGGTINTTTVVGPNQIDVNVTTDAVEATYDIVVDNSGTDNTVWPGNGVNAFEVGAVTGTGPAGNYTEGFETDFGNWVTSGLAADWTRNNGATGSAGTGPNNAGTGTFYIYTEASNPNFPNVEFGLETTNFNVAQSISFDYHMFGADMGDLELQTGFGGVFTTRFTLSGQQQVLQGDAYITQFVDLSSFPVDTIRFRYTSGANFTGDCALDNIVIIST